MRLDFFHSRSVSWSRGLHLTRSTWHSCMMWGWPSLNRGEHLIEWHDYWTLSLRIGDRGWSVQWWPYKASFR